MNSRRAWLCLVSVLTALLGQAACRNQDKETILVITARRGSGPLEGRVATLRITGTVGARMASADFPSPDGTPIGFPSSFSLALPHNLRGPLKLELRGLDPVGTTVARGIRELVEFSAGGRTDLDVVLDCFGSCPAAAPLDAGAPVVDAPVATGPDAPTPRDLAAEQLALCGNAVIDRGESCDIAIAKGLPGACPTNCDDTIACTIDTLVGDNCGRICVYTEIRAAIPGDRCCPADTTVDSDPDCSPTCGNGALEAGEACDRGLSPGTPGACPTAQTCVDTDKCTNDALISANTCSARCVQRPITSLISNDGCCPAGGRFFTDTDCPMVCGNGDLEPNETCDTAIEATRRGACPQTCDDKNSCTADGIEGAGCRAICRNRPITQAIPGDGCCPPGVTRAQDSDCPSTCNNGVAEPGEACDPSVPAGRTGACPVSCPSPTRACVVVVLEGAAAECSARCVERESKTCSSVKDGCCPAGCSAATDIDCSATCGNGTVEAGETCDTAIAAGKPFACAKNCDDKNACTTDRLLSEGTCHATCMNTQVTAYIQGDGCCPPVGNASIDSDCAPVCGNAVVESPTELCDRTVAAGQPGACPTDCGMSPNACTQLILMGTAGACTARCVPEAIRICAGNDGCCPSGCNRSTDSDCAAVCGNTVVEPGEACDKGISAGFPGSCSAVCDDRNACTTDSTSGRVDNCTRTCTFSEIRACAPGDRCCPSGCTQDTDRDCAPAICGNSHTEAGETCDPPSTCPTAACADDGDPCTAARLLGDPTLCTAACVHEPITTCGGTADKCCPTGCTSAKDIDCPAAPM